MDLSSFRPSRIWKRLTAERRRQAAEVFWTDEQSTEQQIEAISAIASHMKFRTKSVVGLPLERKVKYLLSLPSMTDSIAARSLVAYHLEHQRAMMGAFLDALGIAHEDGLISEENVTVPEAEKIQAAAADLAAKYPADDVSLYFSTLVSQDPETWTALTELPQTQHGAQEASS
ncbi:hypothetical protein BH24ACI5_BH24ACI5_10250 [soil metagenome]